VALRRAALVLAALAAAGAAVAAKTNATVVINKLVFGPGPSGVRVGDTVTWVNRDIFQHSVTGTGFDLDLKPGQSGSLVLRRAGEIDYMCRYHPNMKGRVVVAK
jgi:plastocyanin